MAILLIERLQELSGIETKTFVPLFEDLDEWKPKDENLKALVNMHNKIHKMITNYAARDSVEFETRNKIIRMIRNFNNEVRAIWKDYIPKGLKYMTMEYYGEEIRLNPKQSIRAALINARDYLMDAKSIYEWRRVYPLLDRSYSNSHAVLKIIKDIQDQGLDKQEA